MKVKFPKGWSDVTIDRFQKVVALQECADEDVELQRAAALSGIDVDDYPLDARADFRFTAEPPTNSIKSKVKVGKKIFRLFVELDKLSIQEVEDLQSYSKDPIKNLHLLCEIFYTEGKHRRAYVRSESVARAEEMRTTFPVDAAYSACALFLRGASLAVSKMIKDAVPVAQVEPEQENNINY